jgi:hypothetical protein
MGTQPAKQMNRKQRSGAVPALSQDTGEETPALACFDPFLGILFVRLAAVSKGKG